MVRFGLLPRDVRFFDLFEQAGRNMVEVAHALQDLLADYVDVPVKLQRIHDLEHAGDACAHEIMRALNQTFVTPLDREDITALVHALDDVVDQVWAAAARLDIYQIPEPTETARQLARVLVRETEALAEALPYLRRTGDMHRILPATVEVNRLENEADEVLRAGLRSLYASARTVEELSLGLRWREIYDFLAEATDRGEDVADVLEGIVLKMS